MAATIWKGRLNFGLVSIPIRLTRAARAEKVHMHKVQRSTGTRVRQVFVPAAAPEIEPQEEEDEAPVMAAPPSLRGKGPTAVPVPAAVTPGVPAPAAVAPVARGEIVHGFEVEKDRYVKFEPEELEALAPRNSPDMEIVEFVRAEEIDPVYLETSYYVGPDAGGEKPYALLYETLKKSGYAAIGEFVMHRRDQILVLRAGSRGLIGHTLFYEDEVRRVDEFRADAGLVGAKEMDLAMKLVDALKGKFEPEKFKDKYRERLQAAIAAKVESGALTESARPAAAKAAVVDIMAALQESLAKARKPVKSEEKPAAVSGKKTRRAGGA
jgi:DNA end-binding protein Ku